MKVSGFMSRKLITSRPDAGIRETFFRMRAERVRHLPVVDTEGKLVGIISDRDLRRPDWVDEDPDVSHVYQLEDQLLVGDLMTTNVITAHARDRLSKVVMVFREHRFGALPVLDKHEMLVGIITPHDLLAALAECLDTQRKKGR